MGSKIHPIDRIFDEREKSQVHPIDRIFDEREAQAKANPALASDMGGNYNPNPIVPQASQMIGPALTASTYAVANEAVPALASLGGGAVGSLASALHPALGFVAAPTGSTVAGHAARALQDALTTDKFKQDTLAARQASPQAYDTVANLFNLFLGARPSKLKEIAEKPVQKFVSGVGQGVISKAVGDALETRNPLAGLQGAIDATPGEIADYMAEMGRSGVLSTVTSPNKLGRYVGDREYRKGLTNQKTARRVLDEVFLPGDQKQVVQQNLSVQDPLNTGGVNLLASQQAAEGPAGKAPGALQLLDYLSTRDASGQLAKRQDENYSNIVSNINEGLKVNPDVQPGAIREEALSQFGKLQSAADQEAQMFRTEAEQQSQAQRALEAQRARKLRDTGTGMVEAVKGQTAQEIEALRNAAGPLAKQTLEQGLQSAADLKARGETTNQEFLRQQEEARIAAEKAKQGVEAVQSEVRAKYGKNALLDPQEIARSEYEARKADAKRVVDELKSKLPSDLPIDTESIRKVATDLRDAKVLDPSGTIDKFLAATGEPVITEDGKVSKTEATPRKLSFAELHDMSTQLGNSIRDLLVKNTGANSTNEANQLIKLKEAIDKSLFETGSFPEEHPLTKFRTSYREEFAPYFVHDLAGDLFKKGQRGGKHDIYAEDTLHIAMGPNASRQDAKQFAAVLSRSPEGRKAMKDYLDARIANEVGDNLTPQNLEKWRGANEHILDQVPEYKAAFKVVQNRVNQAHADADTTFATLDEIKKRKVQSVEGEASKLEKLAKASSEGILSSAEKQAQELAKKERDRVSEIEDKAAKKVAGRTSMLEKDVSLRQKTAEQKAKEALDAAERAKAEHPLEPFVKQDAVEADYPAIVQGIMSGTYANTKTEKVLRSVANNPQAKEAFLNEAKRHLRDQVSTKSFVEPEGGSPTQGERNVSATSLGRKLVDTAPTRRIAETVFGKDSPELKVLDQAYAQMHAISRQSRTNNSATESRRQTADRVNASMEGSLLQSLAGLGKLGRTTREGISVLKGIWGTSPQPEAVNKLLTEAQLDPVLMKELLRPIKNMSPERIQKVKGLIAPYIAPRIPTKDITPAPEDFEQ